MTPPARAQAAIELLDQIIGAARGGGAAADTLIARYFAGRRYAGSGDRRAVRELVYAAIRACGEVPVSGRAAMLALVGDPEERARLFDGSAHGPATWGEGEPVAPAGIAPGWLVSALAEAGIAGDELGALIDRAPLDVRINRLLPGDDIGGETIPGLPDARRLAAGTDLRGAEGLIEVQDAGSQCVTLASQAQPGMAVIDLCAGSGGKTLALAAMMDNRGAILATDTDRDRLARFTPRAARAGVSIAEPRLLDPGHEAAMLADWAVRAEIVFVDAPCSGTGTWRRNPEARWRLTPDRLARLAQTQARLIDLAAALVKPGGAIVYVVCSLLDDEGAAQIAGFAARHPGFRVVPLALPLGRRHGSGMRLTPHHDATDGFFVARAIAPC